MNITENPEQLLKLAMECKECGNCNKCKYTDDERCLDNLMYNSNTAEKAELIVQMYLLGANDQIERTKEADNGKE
jgi:hypothetical protein